MIVYKNDYQTYLDHELRQLKIHSFKFDKFGTINLMVVLHQILIDETLKFLRVCVVNV